MKPSEILRKAKALIDTPEKWTQGFFALDINGKPVSENEFYACKFCSVGAILRTERVLTNRIPAYDYLGKTMGTYIDKFNDTHTHAEVMAKWDEAIALAEADEKEPELPDGLEILSDGTLQGKCVICNEHYQFLGEPTKFTKEYSYCYGSERCCP